MTKQSAIVTDGRSGRGKLYSYLLCALFAAVTAILSQIMIPLPFTPVPVNLALLAVWVCGGALGPKKAAVSMVVYILLGAIGVPVFVGFAGGLGALAGPTGGYIIGYLPSAVVFGAMLNLRGEDKRGRFMRLPDEDKRGRFMRLPDNQTQEPPQSGPRKSDSAKRLVIRVIRCIPAMLVCYILGTIWFMILTGLALLPALVMCVFPFIPGDILKLIAAVLILDALRKPLRAVG